MAVELGERYVDPITGFEGVATARHEYLYGCVRVTLEGKTAGSELGEFVVDEQRLTETPRATSGGARPVPSRTGLRP